jgi:ribonuclease HI
VELLGYCLPLNLEVVYNKEAHDRGFNRPYNPHVVIKNYVRDYDIAKRAGGIVQVRNILCQHIGWKLPELDWIVVNTDGARTSAGSCGCAGVVRDSSGEWLGGYARALGDCSNIITELWGILKGLRLAWRLGFRHVELRNDSLSVIKRLSSEESGISEGRSVLKHIRRLLQLEWEVKVCHTYREANRCADALAHIGCELGSSVIFYESCPTQIMHFFYDKVGISIPRLIVL